MPEGSGAMNNVIPIDVELIKGHLDRIVRTSVEETLNALLDAEVDRRDGSGFLHTELGGVFV